jgi:S1-C subfamily serine protease
MASGWRLAIILLIVLAAIPTFGQPRLTAPDPGVFSPTTQSGVSGAVQGTQPQVNVAAAAKALIDPLATPATQALILSVKPERIANLRGTKEAQLYRRVSPSVVLVVTKDGLGSGSLVTAAGDILTNWHVVRGYDQVAVIFKPQTEGQVPTKADVRRGRVIKVDEVSDLALVRVADLPSGVAPVLLGEMVQISVGDDVHAIGHPTGEAWTYTKGVVSQIRQDYQWSTQGTNKRHRADVIQTQTPINPGNSGGPLLNDQAALIGVNSFKAEGEGLNFAVAVDEVQRFLAEPTGRVAESASQSTKSGASGNCQPKQVYEGRNKAGNGNVLSYDLDCAGKPDMEIRVPDDPKEPITAVFDTKRTGKIDLIVFDINRDTKWDVSLHDTKARGTWDLIGLHADGSLIASRFLPYSKETFTRVAGDPATYRH